MPMNAGGWIAHKFDGIGRLVHVVAVCAVELGLGRLWKDDEITRETLTID